MDANKSNASGIKPASIIQEIGSLRSMLSVALHTIPPLPQHMQFRAVVAHDLLSEIDSKATKENRDICLDEAFPVIERGMFACSLSLEDLAKQSSPSICKLSLDMRQHISDMNGLRVKLSVYDSNNHANDKTMMEHKPHTTIAGFGMIAHRMLYTVEAMQRILPKTEGNTISPEQQLVGSCRALAQALQGCVLIEQKRAGISKIHHTARMNAQGILASLCAQPSQQTGRN